MIIMQLNDISKSFGAEEILSNIKIEIKSNDRVAIVGRNGAGKSTILKIMADQLSHDDGEIFKPKDLRIGYLSQHSSLESKQSIWQEMLSIFQPLLKKEQELRSLEQQMANPGGMDESEYEALLQNYDKLHQEFENEGGYRYESEIKAVLTGLAFHTFDYDTPIHALSGGQKTRLSLGKLLLQKPDLLILDEPTNHLDMETLRWLEGYLLNYPGAVTIVSHDRYFLDKVVSIIYEISRNQSKKYVGSYSKYLEQKQKDYEKALKEFEQQQADIKKMEDFVQRNIARASTTKRAQSRRKQLERIQKIDRPLGDESSASFSFQIQRQSGNDVLKVSDLTFQYLGEDSPLFTQVNFHVNRGERVAIVGPNGVGKTTLLKLILSNLQQKQGTIQLGTNVQIGYYDQEQANLTSNKTVLNELWDDYPTTMEKEIRTILGNFLFSGDDVLRPVQALSGGEKARLALAKLMMQKANLLVLDEPTNHLDIDSKEVLEAALINFPGTIVFVSHDRYFINQIADQVIELNHDGATVYLGDYDYYVEKKQTALEIAKLNEAEQSQAPEKKEKSQRLSYEQEKKLQSEKRKKQREIEKIETKIEELEEDLTALEEQMALPEVYQDHEKSLELSTEANHTKQMIEELMEAWEAFHDTPERKV